IEPSGNVLCSSNASQVGRRAENPAWLSSVLASRRPGISPAYRSASGENVIGLAAPILFRDRPTGLVLAELRVGWLSAQLASDLADEDNSIVLVDQSNRAFAITARGVSQSQVIAAARTPGNRAAEAGQLQAASATVAGEGMRVVIVAPMRTAAIG